MPTIKDCIDIYPVKSSDVYNTFFIQIRIIIIFAVLNVKILSGIMERKKERPLFVGIMNVGESLILYEDY